MTVPSSYLDPNVIRDLTNAAQDSDPDYKCIVTLFFYGGMDTHNVLVPRENNPNYDTYIDVRSSGTRIEQEELLVLDDNWGVPDTMPILKTLWDDGEVAFIMDIGPLQEPTKKEDYLSDKARYTPRGLFGHDSQQLTWQAADFTRQTGWTGRTANLLDPTTNDPIFNVGQKVDSSSISLYPSALQGVSFAPLAAVTYEATVLVDASPSGIVNQDDLNVAEENVRNDGDDPPVRQSNLINSSFIDIFNRSVDSQQTTFDSTFTWNDDPDLDQDKKDVINKIFDDAYVDGSGIPSWISVSRRIAEVIYSHKSAGFDQRRQTIFAPFGGWDHHSNLRANDNKFYGVGKVIDTLVSFLKEVGLYDSVVICHGSEFSRTLRSNGNNGTDHAWAGHSFIVGGPVNGGTYPTNYMPDYTLDGPKNDGSTLGRYIPEVAIDQMYAQLLSWFGIPTQHLDLILPNLPLFVGDNNKDYKFVSEPIPEEDDENPITFDLNFI